MISLQSKTIIESKTVPGVKFTVRMLNRIQRAKRDLPVMATRLHLSGLIREYALLGEPDHAPEESLRRAQIEAEYDWLEAQEIYPSVIRAGLVSIEGLEIDGAAATADSLIESSSADYNALIEEIYAASNQAAGLSAAEIKNSPSDSTSPAREAVAPEISSAAPVVV